MCTYLHTYIYSQEATRIVFAEDNPARSGDRRDICWMTKTKEDFYYEEYRSIAFQIRIFRAALDIYGDELRYAAMDAIHPNRWLANLAKYIGNNSGCC